MSSETVLVVGATGTQGGAVTDHLLDRGVAVHALTRRSGSDAARALEDRGATVLEGNLRDGERLRSLIEDVDGAYCVTTFSGAGGTEGEIEQGTTMAEAAAEVGVEQFVFSSVGGPRADTGVPHFDSKFAIEERIEELDLPVTVIRPAFFMYNFERMREAILDGTLALPVEEDTPFQLVAPEDIGALAAAAFADPERYVGEAVELASDERTLGEMAAVFSDATGVEVEARSIPIETVREESGEGMARMVEWRKQHGHEVDIDALRRDLDLTSLETYLRSRGWNE